MPYINKDLRNNVDPEIEALVKRIQEVCEYNGTDPDGILNYAITRIIMSFFEGKYAKFARGLGCLEAVKQEYYRRAVAPYEDKKKDQAGDVY